MQISATALVEDRFKEMRGEGKKIDPYLVKSEISVVTVQLTEVINNATVMKSASKEDFSIP